MKTQNTNIKIILKFLLILTIVMTSANFSFSIANAAKDNGMRQEFILKPNKTYTFTINTGPAGFDFWKRVNVGVDNLGRNPITLVSPVNKTVNKGASWSRSVGKQTTVVIKIQVRTQGKVAIWTTEGWITDLSN